jgi:hypothetical protein
LKYPIEIQNLPKNSGISVERPWQFNQITLNGEPLSFLSDSFFVDRAFRVAPTLGLLKKGTNWVEMHLPFKPAIETSESAEERYGSEIESIYLIGDFAVKGNNQATSMESLRNKDNNLTPRPVHSFGSFSVIDEKEQFEGDMTLEGYPFYNGAFQVTKQFQVNQLDQKKKYYFEFPETEAIVAVVALNGMVLDTVCWSPYRVEITPALKPGNNEITITLVSSLRNLLGPHHQKNGELNKVGPYSFGGSGGFPDARGDSNWYELRLEGKPTRIWTDTYHMVPFGFLKAPFITVGE